MDLISMFQKQIIRIGNAKNYIDNIVDGIYVGDRFQFRILFSMFSKTLSYSRTIMYYYRTLKRDGDNNGALLS